MKRLCLFTLVLCTLAASAVVPAAFAAENEAVDKGSVLFDIGTAFVFSHFFNDPTETDIYLGGGGNLNVSYFVIDRFAVGGTVYFANLKWEGAPEARMMFMASPEVRYYFPLSDKTLWNLVGGVFYSSSRDPGDDPFTRLGFQGGGAFTYLLKTYFGLYVDARFVLALDGKKGGSTVADTGFTKLWVGLGFVTFL
jgi:hypothetical protein